MSDEPLVLRESPTDGISALAWSPRESTLLAAASWDCFARLYDTSRDSVAAKYECPAPVLDVAWSADGGSLAAGGLDAAVRLFDVGSGAVRVLGAHGGPVRAVAAVPSLGAVASGGWDACVKLFDPRKPPGEALRIALPHRVYTMALAGSGAAAATLIVGTAERQIHFFDLRAAGAPAQRSRESSLKHQTRVLRAMPDGRGYIVGSIEGRCGVEYLADAEQARQKYAFKCHRVADPATPGEDRIFPVNAIAFHPLHGSFATGGGDGGVCVWDFRNKKRLAKLRECDTSVSALAFNLAGDRLAVASSYAWEQGDRPHPPDQIQVRVVSEAEVKPKG